MNCCTKSKSAFKMCIILQIGNNIILKPSLLITKIPVTGTFLFFKEHFCICEEHFYIFVEHISVFARNMSIYSENIYICEVHDSLINATHVCIMNHNICIRTTALKSLIIRSVFPRQICIQELFVCL